jgi:hypothetical protein
MIRRRLEAGQSKRGKTCRIERHDTKHNEAAEVLFPATCRCASLSVFPGYWTKCAMPRLLQKLIEIS